MYRILERTGDSSLERFLETYCKSIVGDNFEETSEPSIIRQDGESPNFNDTNGTNERLGII